MSHMTQKPPRAVRAYLAEIGRRGGLQRSAAKTAAATANAKKPRPGRRKSAAAQVGQEIGLLAKKLPAR